MDKDRIKGSLKQAVGGAKQATGKVLGDRKMQMDGKAEKTAGRIQNAVGGIKDEIRKAVKR